MEKFEIGDKVKVVRLDTTKNDYVSELNRYLGYTGTIHDKQFSGSEQLVKFDNENSWYFYPDWLELVEKAKKGWTGQVVCTSITYPCGEYFTPGKVYDVKDGFLIDKTGTSYTPTLFNSANDLIDYFKTPRKYRFIEFKGFCKNGKE